MNIVFTISAKEDLKQIKEFISIDNKIYADKVTNSIFYTIYSSLLNFPYLGKSISPSKNLREIVENTYKYQIIYKVDGEQIKIISIFKHKNPSNQIKTSFLNSQAQLLSNII